MPMCLDCSLEIDDVEAGRPGHAVVPGDSAMDGHVRWTCLGCDLREVPVGVLRQRLCPRSGAPDQVLLRNEHRRRAHTVVRHRGCGACVVRFGSESPAESMKDAVPYIATPDGSAGSRKRRVWRAARPARHLRGR